MVVANIAFILMHPAGTENRNKLPSPITVHDETV